MNVSDRDLIIAHLIVAHYHINKFSELWDESMKVVKEQSEKTKNDG